MKEKLVSNGGLLGVTSNSYNFYFPDGTALRAAVATPEESKQQYELHQVHNMASPCTLDCMSNTEQLKQHEHLE